MEGYRFTDDDWAEIDGQPTEALQTEKKNEILLRGLSILKAEEQEALSAKDSNDNLVNRDLWRTAEEGSEELEEETARTLLRERTVEPETGDSDARRRPFIAFMQPHLKAGLGSDRGIRRASGRAEEQLQDGNCSVFYQVCEVREEGSRLEPGAIYRVPETESLIEFSKKVAVAGARRQAAFRKRGLTDDKRNYPKIKEGQASVANVSVDAGIVTCKTCEKKWKLLRTEAKGSPRSRWWVCPNDCNLPAGDSEFRRGCEPTTDERDWPADVVIDSSVAAPIDPHTERREYKEVLDEITAKIDQIPDHEIKPAKRERWKLVLVESMYEDFTYRSKNHETGRITAIAEQLGISECLVKKDRKEIKARFFEDFFKKRSMKEKPLQARSIAPPALGIHPDPPETSTPWIRAFYNPPDLPPDFEEGYLVQCLTLHRAKERKLAEAKRAAHFAARHEAINHVAKSEEWAAFSVAAEAESAILAENYFKRVTPPYDDVWSVVGMCDLLKQRLAEAEAQKKEEEARKEAQWKAWQAENQAAAGVSHRVAA
jgi:hypothetical protein